MKLKLKIDNRTTASELVHLGMLFTALGLNSGAKVFAAPTDPAELDEGEGDVVHIPVTPEQEAAIDAATGITPKRRRRTKEEIAAAQAAAPGTTVESTQPITDSDPHQTIVEQAAEQATATVEDAVGNVQPASTPPATEPPAEAAATEPATASPSDVPVTAGPATDGKTYTAAEVQQQATVVARTHGADLVKAKIAELGGARIAELGADQVNELGAYLFSVK